MVQWLRTWAPEPGCLDSNRSTICELYEPNLPVCVSSPASQTGTALASIEVRVMANIPKALRIVLGPSTC